MEVYSNICEPELTEQIKQGEKRAYRKIFEHYAPRIFRFANAYLKSNEDAEELVQDVFMQIWEKRNALDKNKNLEAFLFKVAVNAIYDFIRRKNIEQAYLDFIEHSSQASLENTWQTVIYNDMLEQLEILVEVFPEQQRKIFRLSKEKGLTNDEIATKLNLSKRTVENQLYRATATLKKYYSQGSFTGLLFFYLYCI